MVFIRLLSILLFVLLSTGYSYGQAEIPKGSKCGQCGMYVEQNSRFASKVIDNNRKVLFFCDIGDMFFHFRSAKNKLKSVFVRDYLTGEWIDGKTAFYVFNKTLNSPMSWNIGAFSKESDAKKIGSAVDFPSAFKLLTT